MNILVDFVLNKNNRGSNNTRKHPGRVVQGHRLAPLMKKRKGEILRNKEQSKE